MKKLLPFIFAALAACSSPVDTEAARQAVRDFHDQLDTRQFNTIYDRSSSDFKKLTTRQDFIAFLDAVHRKLGESKSFQLKTATTTYTPSGTVLTLDYESTFAEGDALETFTYQKQDNMPLLVGYQITSNALILK